MKCTVCNHPRSHDIDLAILSGNYTFDELKQLYGPSRSALWRHKNHLYAKISRAQASLEHNVRLGYLFKLNALLDEASDTIKISREEGNARLRLQAVNASARLVQAMDKMAVRLDRATVYRLLTSPEDSLSDCLLPTTPDLLADNFQTLAFGFMFPCPEAEPRELTDPEDVKDKREDCQDQKEERMEGEDVATDAADAAGEADLEAAPEVISQLSPTEACDLANFLAQAAQLLDSPDLLSDPDSSATQARQKRDANATKGRLTAPRVKEIKKKQLVNQDAKKSATTPATPQKSALGNPLLAMNNSKLLRRNLSLTAPATNGPIPPPRPTPPKLAPLTTGP